ncbi:MAG: restriction endonuclease, partial [Oligoflexia bacterium]|nr:restriction endonuclease [Oligoflexia bacterium]
VAHDLGRKFITGDISPVAVRVIKDRLKKAGCNNYVDCNPYLTKPEWRAIKGHTFADKVCEYMGWTANSKKSGDGGIDGWTDDRKRIPVQIKNSDVNVSVIRDMAGVCNNTYKNAVVVGWSFSKGCYEFVSALERKSKIKIELKSAETIVQPIGYIDKVKWQKLYSERVKESKKQPQIIDDRKISA